MRRWFALFALAVLTAACAMPPLARVSDAEREAIAARMMADITVLASDEFGGRKPGTEGERLTVEYLIQRYQEIGLVSGTNIPGSPWRAPVPLATTRGRESKVILNAGEGPLEIDSTQAIAITAARRVLLEDAQSVFLGAADRPPPPADVIAGKVAVVLDERRNNRARNLKLIELGAAAVLAIAERPTMIENLRYWSERETVRLGGADSDWLFAFVTQEAFATTVGAEQWEMLSSAAKSETFQPMPLDLTVSLEVVGDRREFTSYNVLGRLPGSIPDSGAVLLLAHWDHLGECGEADAQDRICNGANDNASGLAFMLELARRLTAKGPHDRDIYLLATSAEEAGLLGAQTFAGNPPIPLEQFVAAFNFDTMALAPAGAPIGFIGEGMTPLDPIVLDVLKQAKRDLGNAGYARQFARRHDGWVLLDKGVPSVFLSSTFGSEIVLGPYLENDYHKASDEADKLEMGGAVDDLLLHEELVTRLASTATYPGQ